MIVSSFLEQYGIRLYDEYNTITLKEYNSLLAGISEKTSLGKTVLIRAESDAETIKNMTKHEKEIRKEWQEFKTKKQTKEEKEKQINQFMELLKSLSEKG